MATRRRRVRRLRIGVQQNVSAALRGLDVALGGAAMDAALLEAADYLAGLARARAPRRTGRMQRGIYTANAFRNNHPGGKVARLTRPPKPGSAVVAGGALHQRFFEYGRKKKKGRVRGKPFFRQAITSGLPGAKAIIAKRAKAIIEANK